MWARSIVHSFAMVTVHAKHLETLREVVTRQPEVRSVPGVCPVASNVPAPLGPVIIDVIDCQKLFRIFTTTRANIPTVCSKNGILHNTPFPDSVCSIFRPLVGPAKMRPSSYPPSPALLAMALYVYRAQNTSGPWATVISSIEIRQRLLVSAFATYFQVLARYCHRLFSL
jgi:hypothetical protein